MTQLALQTQGDLDLPYDAKSARFRRFLQILGMMQDRDVPPPQTIQYYDIQEQWTAAFPDGSTLYGFGPTVSEDPFLVQHRTGQVCMATDRLLPHDSA